MSIHHDYDESRQLDRLVDGELSSEEYRVLLAALEEEPGGWRRCAMAFLEAQAWKQEFVRWPSEAGEPLPDSLGGPSYKGIDLDRTKYVGPSHRRLVGLVLSMAASFVMVFASGVWWQRSNSSDPIDSDSPVDSVPIVTRQAEDSPSEVSDETPVQLASETPMPGEIPTEHLTFVVDRADGGSDRFELPIYGANDPVARELLRDSPSMPEDVERAIRDSGFDVTSQRQWTPVQLRDGRRAYFPIDQLDIKPASRTTYH